MRAALVTALVAVSCGGGDDAAPADAPPGGPVIHDHLAEYGLFLGTGATQAPAPGVVPYAVNAELFADYALKHRFLALPPGGAIGYDAAQPWRFPIGTIIVKTFASAADLRDPLSPQRLLETRLLVRGAAGWTGHVYLWNDAQDDAVRTVAGARVPVTWIDSDGVTQTLDYRVPNTNQCLTCHGEAGTTELLGVRTRQLNRAFDYGAGAENQLDHLEALGAFDAPLPPAAMRPALADPFGAAPLDARARAYLDVNCAHCHRAGGAAGDTGLLLAADVTAPIDFGVCRRPVAAGIGAGGFFYDIVPGAPAESIVVFRLQSIDPAIRMPELGRQVVHTAGVALITEWIATLAPPGCP